VRDAASGTGLGVCDLAKPKTERDVHLAKPKSERDVHLAKPKSERVSTALKRAHVHKQYVTRKCTQPSYPCTRTNNNACPRRHSHITARLKPHT
jgi:hypothetical protein